VQELVKRDMSHVSFSPIKRGRNEKSLTNLHAFCYVLLCSDFADDQSSNSVGVVYEGLQARTREPSNQQSPIYTDLTTVVGDQQRNSVEAVYVNVPRRP